MRRSRVLRWMARVALAVGAVALLARAFAHIDWGATWRVVASAGPAALLALVPFGVALLVDTSGVVLLARAARIVIAPGPALAVRAACEALHFGAPGGVVASEAAAVALYAKRCNLEAAEAACVVARRKQLVMRAHAAYLALTAATGAAALGEVGRTTHARALASLVFASAVIPLALSLALGFGVARTPRLREAFARFADGRHFTLLGTMSFLAGWLVESAETAIILRISGIPMPMPSVLAVESALSLARSAAAFVPGGLGVQDLGYTTALAALGAPSDHVAAFVLLKRAKEIVWIAIGFTASALVTRSSQGRAQIAT